jgi:hypothetical protein
MISKEWFQFARFRFLNQGVWTKQALAWNFVKGGARENQPPGGVEKSMLIFEGTFGRIVGGKRRL